MAHRLAAAVKAIRVSCNVLFVTRRAVVQTENIHMRHKTTV